LKGGSKGEAKVEKHERVPIGGSPFHCVVAPGAPSSQMSTIDGWAKESRALDKHGKVADPNPDTIIAGDSVVLRPTICDALGNLTTLAEGALDVVVHYPDGSSTRGSQPSSGLKFGTQSKGGVTTYDVRSEVTRAGSYSVEVLLGGELIRGSPVLFEVVEAAAEVKNAKIVPPRESPLYSNTTYSLKLQTFDRFSNAIAHGGLLVGARLQLIKQGVHDLTTLMPSNHSVEIEDNGDGTYNVHVTIIKIVASVKVIINMDKNMPAAGGELPPVQLTFVPQPSSSGSLDASRNGGERSPQALRPQSAAEETQVRFSTPQDDIIPTGNQKLQAAGDAVLNMLEGSTAEMRPQAAGVATKAGVVDAFRKEGDKRKEQRKAERAEALASAPIRKRKP